MSKENNDKYFEEINKKINAAYAVAEDARKVGYDPVDFVEIPLAKNMAERVVGLISSVAPQIKDTGIVERIQELEKEGKIAEDDKFRGKERLQEAVNDYNKKVDDMREKISENLSFAIRIYPEWAAAKKEETKAAIANLSPGEKIVAEAVENKISKLSFKTNIRFAYIARNDIFSRANMAAITGAFKQFNTINMNAFKGDSKQGTSGNQPFKKRREYLKKVKFVERLVNRGWGKKDYILNTEELATIYHYPILVVEAPTMRRVEAKKAEPPVSLPVG